MKQDISETSPTTDLFQQFILVVGSVRSGTSIVGRSLRRAYKIPSSFGECHILSLLPNLITTVSGYYAEHDRHVNIPGMLISAIPTSFWTSGFVDLTRKAYRDIGKFADVVIDKTPGNAIIPQLPLLMRLFPEMKIIYMHRRGIENICSRLKKFPRTPFETHCRDWSSNISMWAKIKKRLKKNLLIEIDQYDVSYYPGQVAAKLRDFLSLSVDQQKSIEKCFLSDHPQSTQSSRDPLSIKNIGWSSDQQMTFIDICATAMSQYGYLLDQKYRDINSQDSRSSETELTGN